jgi:hypothetical protein
MRKKSLLVCDTCGMETKYCIGCNKNFKFNDEIICIEHKYHFCSEKCVKKGLIVKKGTMRWVG